MGLFDDISARAKREVTAGVVAADAVARRHVPPGVVAARKIPSRVLRGGAGGQVANPRNTRTPLLGGITLDQAARMHAEMRSVDRAKKNLFVIEVSDLSTSNNSLPEGDGFYSFNFFAVEVNYAPLTISGEKRRVGGVMLDGLTGNEPVEMRITTFDDTEGTLKRWFSSKAESIAHKDGTVGVPADYLVKIVVSHAFVAGAEGKPFREEFLMRAVNIEHDLSRRDDAMAELQMTFTETDTQVRP